MEKIIADWEILSSETRKEIERIIRADELKRQYMEELYTLPCYRDFFEHYSEESVHTFISEYAKRKAYYALHGERAAVAQSESELRFRHLAEKYFAEIQQKKLFDLQCLWRAGEITLEGVVSSSDFAALEFCIFSIPFLKPVTQHELNIYLDYLATEESVSGHEYRWQDYSAFKTAFDSGQHKHIPGWYQFYDKALGAESLLKLENKREAEEMLWLNHSSVYQESRPDTDLVKPDLEFNYHTLEFFVYTFEDRNNIRNFLAVERFHPDIDDNKLLFDSWKLLLESSDEINIATTGNWKKALIETANRYRKQKVAECLKDLFREYQLRLAAGIPVHYGENDALFEYYSIKASHYYQKISSAKISAGK